MSSSLRRPTAVDLFSGAGGLSQGLESAGFELIAAADHDPDACATHRLNFPTAHVVEGDLTASDKHAELIASLPAGRQVDLLAGGPPCQAFSQIHNHDRLIEDPRNRLYREFVTLLAEIRPRALLLENVPGMEQMQGGAVRRQIEADLSLDGAYRVVSGVLDAGDFGTPQRRPRLVFIGLEAGVGEPSLPVGSGLSRFLRSQPSGELSLQLGDDHAYWMAALADPSDDRAVTVSQALSDLVEPGDRYTRRTLTAFQRRIRNGSRKPQDHVPSKIRDDTRTRLEAIPPGGNIYDLPEDLRARYLGSERWGPKGDGTQLSRKHFYAYRRLHPDWLAWTVNTKADFAYHYAVPRGLSVREAARLQGFPDSFHFTTAPPGSVGQLKNGARHSRYRQVGNAVPPRLGEAVGRHVLDLIGFKAAALRVVEAA